MNFTNSSKYIKKSQLSNYSKCLLPDDFGYPDPCCVAFQEYKYTFPLHSIIINEGEGIISLPLKRREFEIKMFDCKRNELKFNENVILPSTTTTAVGRPTSSFTTPLPVPSARAREHYTVATAVPTSR